MPKFNDITGQRFGRLVAIKPEKKTSGGYRWLCLCDCGNELYAPHSTALITGHTKSCGCLREGSHKGKTIDDLAEYISYDPVTGIFINLIDRGANAKEGSTAGFLHDGYINIKFLGLTYTGHQLAWFITYGIWPTLLDHKNRIRTDNRIKNLVEVTFEENAQNRSVPSNNASGFIGVCYHKMTGRWQSYITISGKRVYIGLYDTPEEANEARIKTEHDEGFYRHK